ncbi:hypothetical protein [Caballeronia sp. ATUFL_F2_KS9A]|uniref:hypothetical protein n=1 Tax=Caballeronia sp. ATUFL_F2_KS9A TaxID=2921777 RepID=UPI002027798A|nr:hypothetical protein [Caballeronia sp. ATUFL_F2_KS9A]
MPGSVLTHRFDPKSLVIGTFALFGWSEEPVPPEDREGHMQVKRALSIPVAGGEC